MTRAESVETKLHVGQGEHVVADRPDAVLTAILGSCVAACIWDPQARVGGMNHIVLPDVPDGDLRRSSAGVNAMELLINGILRAGGARDRLQAKLFGGARMIEGLSDVGARNADFARRFLACEAIPCLSESLGGSQGRRVQFWPYTGRARQLLMASSHVPREEIVPPRLPASAGNDIELF
jgi:chemotaxis protein CheD